MNPYVFRPILKEVLWGGAAICPFKSLPPDPRKIGESWEVSDVDGRPSVVADGPEEGVTLGELVRRHGADLVGGRVLERFGSRFPLLVKFIDARDDLSVQVHPDDNLAHARHGALGKTEMWYVMDAAPGAELLYGFQHEITKAEFRRHIEESTLLDVVRHVPVQKGDVFFIPAGTLHAIGKGILICEIQQNSNTTYRVYDYGRIGTDGKQRELHIEKALDVTCLAPAAQYTAVGTEASICTGAKSRLLAACDYFTVYHLVIDGACVLPVGDDSFQCLTLLSGNLTLRTDTDALSLQKGESVFLPAGMGACRLTGTAELILSKI